MIPRASNRRRRAAAVPALVAACLCMASCAGVDHLREAQESFTRAAELENEARVREAGLVGEVASDPGADSVRILVDGARVHYLHAIAALEEITPSEDEALDRDRLLVTKRTLLALCQWRVGRFDEAKRTAAGALRASDPEAAPRDRALLLALPGLVMIDQAYGKIRLRDAPYREVERLLLDPDTGAIHHLDAALRQAGDAPVAVYLLQCRLAVLKNVMDAKAALDSSPELPPGVRERAVATLRRLAEAPALAARPEARDRVVELWRKALVIDTDELR